MLILTARTFRASSRFIKLLMAPGSPSGKRKASTSSSISPPPIKRKVQGGTTKSAVANFFTPASQKPKERTTWSDRSVNEDTLATLLIGRYEPEDTKPDNQVRKKVAAFDLDSTLITTSSGKKHAGSGNDWKWWDNQVPGRLRELYEKDGYRVVILSNQAGLTLHFPPNFKGPKANTQKRLGDFKQKCNAVLTQLDLPVSVYAATAHDIYRKPRTGMWKELCEDYNIDMKDVDLQESIFVGDAGGRTATVVKQAGQELSTGKDFSCSDRNFAHNVGIKYQTPEEFFLGQEPRDFVRELDIANHPFQESADADSATTISFEKKHDRDIVLFCGPPGAGKSTFYWKHLKPLGYERINQGVLKSRDKCVKVAEERLSEGGSVAIDNTNADVDTRAVWISLATKFKLPIRCVWFTTPIQICQHNDAVRSCNKEMNPESRQNLPNLAFTGFMSRYKAPQTKEGFEDITEVKFQFRGTKEEYDLWARYWI